MSDHEARFRALLSDIERDLDAPMDIASLCRRVHLSPFHFHRQCSAYFGVSVMTLIRLLRLKRAAWQLAYRQHQSVTAIALGAGYDSLEGFSRAFSKYFAMSPSAFRRRPDWQNWAQHHEPLRQLRIKHMYSASEQPLSVVTVNPVMVACLTHQGSPQQLSHSIQAFIRWRQAKGLSPAKSRTFNIFYGDPATTPPADFRLDLCCTITEPLAAADQPVVAKTIAGGRYARLRHIGSDETLGSAIAFLYRQWLPASGYELREEPLFVERLQFYPEVPETEAVTDIYLPVQ
ncbi:GyrI-like domain-containing protein [Gallaecimonas sp. GXIMD1310]|uniref:AraC family transcriptional regulator n=1 Tax=Gallaecimonas sp. GXIMD1310 TaxID=3131926 RepID=UPI0032555B4E